MKTVTGPQREAASPEADDGTPPAAPPGGPEPEPVKPPAAETVPVPLSPPAAETVPVPLSPRRPQPAPSGGSEATGATAGSSATGATAGYRAAESGESRASGASASSSATGATAGYRAAESGESRASGASASNSDSTFWLPTEEIPRDALAGAWPLAQMRPGRAPVFRADGDAVKPRLPKAPRRPASGLAILLVLALLGAFFAWVTAEPLWLAVGHGDRGTATVTRCTGGGVGQRCVGEFTAAGGAFTTEEVSLLGVGGDDRRSGATVPARMVSAEHAESGPLPRAYVGDMVGLHLRWGIGLVLILLCGVGIAWATGALRLADRRSRRRAVLASLAAPLLLMIGFLAATW
jgi:hypothetical protein